MYEKPNISYSYKNVGENYDINKKNIEISSRYINNPSITHRLDKKVKNEKIVKFNVDNELGTMFDDNFF